ncbi:MULTISPECIES: DUF488 domain-containing protein [unclassified Moorena]|uniref:DUF488 domain-containing protein n=1 Tax=unclassified Moorena TaxID=2683338 RepID=UPI0013C22E2C|nr:MULTISPECIES: DUF488 domain-containing protein [unclassified Moorena]NES41981.1 DUF488 domain-containing protein [Moorena sp. SIO2C4]NET69272.1 DUF488 domain-containing protein [Moorena sp. SIO1G6]
MNKTINLFTIGFTKKSAQQFFELLINAGVRRVIDTRLNNKSQLAGFTKKTDFEYFLQQIGNIDYIHRLELAPTKDIINTYKKNNGDWETYEKQFLELITEREIEKTVSPDLLDGSCLLCSEPTPHNCHRRLVAEYLSQKLGTIKIVHL